MERRAYAPGQHGRARKRVLGYGIQLREKQKLKRFYGMSEEQFRFFFQRAERQKGVNGENLLSMLERRLDKIDIRTAAIEAKIFKRAPKSDRDD